MKVLSESFLSLLVLALLWLLNPIAANAGQTYYVSPTGNDTQPGTQAQPLRQIRKALAKVKAGDLVLVADGSYLGFDVDTMVGSNTAPLMLQAQGTNAVVLPTTDRSDNRDTIFIVDSTYVIIDGFRSFNANRAALRIEGGNHITVRHCVFGNNATWGILTGHSADLLIEKNICYGSVNQHGIYVANSADRPIVRGNRCYANYGCGIHMNADLYTPPGDGIITGALIEDNILYDNGVGGGGAINMDGVQDSVVRNNLLFNNHASGIILFQIDGAEGPRENWIYHNTIDQASNGRWALGLKQTTGTNYVRNNILYNRGSFRGGLQFGNASDADNTDTDYNVVNLITIDDGDSRLSLAQWQAQGPDQHSRTGAVAALFVDANRGNYLLGTNSPAVDAAQLLSTMLTDMDGAPRLFGSAPDMGCYEQRPLALQLVSTNPSSFRIELSGGAGRSNAIETSTALTNWMPLTSLTRSNLPLETAITNDGTHRFYRAVCIP
jgi:parallel beta-helix repeat protein